MATRVRGVAEIVLWVHDMPRALGFYREVLGLEQISPPERPSPVFLRAGPAAVGVPQLIVLVQLPPDAGPFSKPRPLHHLALEIAREDFDAEKARLESLGFQLRTGQHPIIPSRTLYLDDPEGNEVELICTA
ncbi:MAG TPA: VOC family protein [Chloroflexota bacterium]|jgi:catechol 2,3-dioxygenase